MNFFYSLQIIQGGFYMNFLKVHHATREESGLFLARMMIELE